MNRRACPSSQLTVTRLRTATGNQCNRINSRFGSWSWDQPASAGIAGWEGRCGQTCVSNLLANSPGGTRVTPQRVIQTAWDVTPGSLPSTVLRALRRLAPMNGRTYSLSENDENALSDATPTNPIGCLVAWSPSTLHWITPVGTTSSHVFFNHWGRQQSLTRDEFSKRWGFKNQNWTGAVSTLLANLSPYTAVV